MAFIQYISLFILFQKIQTLLVYLFIYIFIYFNIIRSKEYFYSGIIQNICYSDAWVGMWISIQLHCGYF